VLRQLRRAYPDATCSLDHSSPLELLVATILSAQCTDERVNQVTPELFRAYPTAASYARADLAALEEAVRTTGFYRNKARHIRAAADAVARRHGGQVPRTMEELLELPGVARKTANVVLGTAYGLATGVVVDTHVLRVSRRLGLARGKTPEQVEAELMDLFPRSSWIWLAHALIQHGRRVCVARKPRCGACPLAARCPSREKGSGS
jgi:endonuclease-3